MLIVNQNAYYSIELSKGEKLTVASTYEVVKKAYDTADLRSVKIDVYDNFFVVRFTDRGGKPKCHAYSDTWDFSVQ